MAQVLQRQRPEVNTATSERCKSKLFLKRMLAISVSNITYVRNIFPEHVYADRNFNEMKLKILKENGHPGAKQIVQWMRGVYDALEHEYLRVLIFAIVADKEDANSVLESYTYGFTYEEDGSVNTSLTVGSDHNKVTSIPSKKKTQESAKQLLRNLIVLTSSLEDLPDTVYMTARLLYYDDKTPENYQPPGFQCATQDDTLSFLSDNIRIKVGEIVTPFSTMKLRVRTEKGKLDDKTFPVKTQAPSNLSQATLLPTFSEAEAMQNESQITQMDVDTQSELNTNTNQKENKNENEAGFGVRCPCKDDEEDGVMILCSECNFWQHAICFCLPDSATITDKHYCHLCSDNINNICTDPRLSGLNEEKQREIACWRRALMNCFETTKVSVQDLCMKLTCKRPFAQKLLGKLLQEKILTIAKGQRHQKIVNKEVLNEVFEREIKHVSKNLQRQRGEYVTDSNQSSANLDKEIGNGTNNIQTQKKSEKRKIIESPLQSQLSVDHFQDTSLIRRSARQKRMKLSKTESIRSHVN